MKIRYFSLLEMVVSLGLLAMILLIASLSISAAWRTWQSISEHENELKQYRLIDKIMDNAFRNAVPFHWKDRNNKEVMLFAGRQTSIFLTYLHRVDDRQTGGIRFLRLFREDNQLIAEYRNLPYFAGEPGQAKVEREILAKDISSLEFVYADNYENKFTWYDEWDIDRMKNLPAAIQLEVQFQNGQKQVWLRRTAGNGLYQEWGRRLIPQR